MSTEAKLDTPSATAPVASQPLRFVTAASLFDGHDAAINMIRRLLQAQRRRGGAPGPQPQRRGHRARRDPGGRRRASPSARYQGGHNEYFTYMVDMLREHGAEHIRVVVRRRRHDRARTRSRSSRPTASSGSTRPRTAARSGLDGMIDDVFARVRTRAASRASAVRSGRARATIGTIARTISALEDGALDADGSSDDLRAPWRARRRTARRSSASPAPAAPASQSLTDELVHRFLRHFPDRQHRGRRHGSDAAPLRRRAARRPHPHERAAPTSSVFMRSLATRRQHLATSAVLADVDRAAQARRAST